jgi:hypothetical protein
MEVADIRYLNLQMQVSIFKECCRYIYRYTCERCRYLQILPVSADAGDEFDDENRSGNRLSAGSPASVLCLSSYELI